MTTPKHPNLDSVTTINADGSRYYLHPSDVRGRFTTARKLFGLLLIAIYAALPWIPINGNPALFLDIETRQFHIFGLTLVPQDLWVLFFCITGLGFALFFLTSLLGRLWCGWACPYTVFLDHIFRRIERLIEGDAPARKQLDSAPWGGAKIFKRVAKHTFYGISAFLIAQIFLSYFVSLPRLYRYMGESPLEHATAFGVVLFLTVVLWFCFGWFREQFCIIICPYGRLQSVLTDDDTINIGYDEIRGEPRGKQGAVTGDCIDCRRCVNVCPTGIDIRNGLQLECIGCSACVDACDEVMVKIGRPKGLVRYDSLNGLAGKKRRILRPRIYAYSALACVGLGVLGVLASMNASPFTTNVIRARGAPFFVDGKSVLNSYSIRFLNKRNQPASFTISLAPGTPDAYVLNIAGRPLSAGPLGEVVQPFMVSTVPGKYTGPANLVIQIKATPGDVVLTQKVPFIGPDPASVPH
jgi:cytochrome c oxidase accessory protein FixG